jgi:hypothetical protein
VLGAVFLDAGYDAAYHYYLNRYRSLPSPAQDENFKGRLQQVAQERFGETPFYDSEGARVGSHREYTSVVFAGPEPLGTGHGPTKQEAEQEAARAALLKLVGPTAAAVPSKPAKTPRTRAPRRPPRSAAATGSSSDTVEGSPEPPVPVLSILPGPEPEPHEPTFEPAPPAPSRSRQFGEPLE